MHELGHTLGLAHSYIGNIMHYSLVNQTGFGVQDIADYTYCWTASTCYKTPH
jgi:predicted Zn-dependent protease